MLKRALPFCFLLCIIAHQLSTLGKFLQMLAEHCSTQLFFVAPAIGVNAIKRNLISTNLLSTSNSNTVRKEATSLKHLNSESSCCYYGNASEVKQIYQQEWPRISPFLLEGRKDNVPGAATKDYCRNEWKKFVLNVIGSNNSFYAQLFVKNNLEYNSFRYVHDDPNLPRILFLGDSVSRGIWTEVYNLYHPLSLANIHGAPDNCGGFQQYEKHLLDWLGECPWDIIQFNVGLHFHSSDLNEYEKQITNVVQQLKNHSPDASIVFALTTPSPFDSYGTFPNRSNCKNYDKFHKKGVVPALNKAILDVITPKLNLTVVDRYRAVQPLLEKYQNPCDVHFTRQGYQELARNDWNTVSKLL